MRKLYAFILLISLSIILTACSDVVDDVISAIDEVEQQESNDNDEQQSGSEKEESKVVEGELEVHFIDVGQGDSILMKTNDVNILVDAGDWNKKDAVEYLKEQDIDKFDLVVGSHPHADHIGQLDTIISDYNVEEVWMTGGESTSQVFMRVVEAIEASGANYDEPRAGDKYEIGDIGIEVVSPEAIGNSPNDDSIVMRVTYGDVTMLLTGDAEKKAEEGMLARGENLEVDILKAGHHGSDTSSTAEFVEEVNPDVVVIQVGESNKYKHPMQSVLDRFKAVNAEIYSNKDNGNVIITTDGESYEVEVDVESEVTSESE